MVGTYDSVEQYPVYPC